MWRIRTSFILLLRHFIRLSAAIIPIVLILSDGSDAVRTDGSTLPVPYMTHGCRIVFSELNLHDNNGLQFIELTRTCEVEPKQSTNKISLGLFKIVFVSHEGFIIGVCHLNGLVSVRAEWLYTIGNENVHNVDMNSEGCEFATVQTPGAPPRFPSGTEYPVGIFLIRNERKSALSNIQLIKKDGKYQPNKVTDTIAQTIIRNTQDYYLVGSKTAFIWCEYFRRFYHAYEPTPTENFILRDLNSRDSTGGKSLSRCTTESDLGFSLPMSPRFFKYTAPTPGSTNDCVNSFSLAQNVYKRARVESNGCSSYFPTNKARNDFFINPNNFQLDLNLAEQEQGGENVGKKDPIEFERIAKSKAPHIVNDCSKFSSSQLMAIQRLPHTPLAVETVLNPKNCNWLDYIFNIKKFRCRFCTDLVIQGIIPERPGSKLVSGIVRNGAGWLVVNTNEQAIKARTYNKKLIVDHSKSEIHLIAEDYYRLIDEGKEGEILKKEFERVGGPLRTYLQATENLILSVIYSVQMNLSFRSFLILGQMLNHFQVNTGFLYQSDSAMRMLAKSISNSLHDNFVKTLRDKPRELSIILDGSTDCGGYSIVAVLFQTAGVDGKVGVYLYRVMEIKTSETGDEIFDKFWSHITEDGLNDVIRSQTVALGTDGGTNVKNRFRSRLSAVTDQELLAVWCTNHRLEIIASRAFRKFDYLIYLDSFINRLARFLTKKSGKRNNVFRQVIREFGFRRFELKRIRPVRWLSHRFRAVIPIINRYEVLVETFQRISLDGTYKLSVRQQAVHLIQQLREPALLATLCFTADAVNIIAKFSGILQTRGNTLIGTYGMRQEMKDFLNGLLVNAGDNVKFLLDNSVILVGNREERADIDINEYQEYHMKFRNITLNEPDCGLSGVCFKNFTEHYISALIQEVDAYFPPTVADLFDIFWPLNIPINLNTLQNYGRAHMKTMNVKLKWGFSNESLIDHWTDLLSSIVGHNDFDHKVDSKPEEFWSHFLQAEGVNWHDDTRFVIKSVLVTPPSSSAAESIFSMYSFIKDRKRHNLLPDSVESLVRIRYSGPKDVKDYDIIAIVRDFLSTHSRADDVSRRSRGYKTASCENENGPDQNDEEMDVDDFESILGQYDEIVADNDIFDDDIDNGQIDDGGVVVNTEIDSDDVVWDEESEDEDISESEDEVISESEDEFISESEDEVVSESEDDDIVVDDEADIDEVDE